MRQSVVSAYQTCASSGYEGDWQLVPFHCEDCGHVFPVALANRIGRCGMCRGTMLPGYGERYHPGDGEA